MPDHQLMRQLTTHPPRRGTRWSEEKCCDSCNLWYTTASGQRRRRQCAFQSSSKFALADSREATTIIAAVASSHHPIGERVDSSGTGGDVLMEVAQAVESTRKSHALMEEHFASPVPERPRGRPATHCWPSSVSLYQAVCAMFGVMSS